MSKKKRLRKELQREEETQDLLEEIFEDVDEARLWIKSSTPFEISSELARMGIRTTHQSGINEFLKSWEFKGDEAGPQSSFEALSDLWMDEIEVKYGEGSIEFEDEILLAEIARHYWTALNGSKVRDLISEFFGDRLA